MNILNIINHQISRPQFKEFYFSEPHWIHVGNMYPIRLQKIDPKIVQKKIGTYLNSGAKGDVFEIKKIYPPRVYKIIPKGSFLNGNEIRLLAMAADLGAAPIFHQAFIYEKDGQDFVVLEMDHAGISLMERIGGSINRYRVAIHYPEEYISLIEEIFPNPEVFYQALFEKIKLLAQKKIGYNDGHPGNIMIKGTTVHFVDFDSARLINSWDDERNIQSAVNTAFISQYIKSFFKNFEKLPNLSIESANLIKWFSNLISDY